MLATSWERRGEREREERERREMLPRV